MGRSCGNARGTGIACSTPLPSIPPAPLQIPGAITTNHNRELHQLPVEVAGWLLGHARCERDTPWILVITEDMKCTLAAALLGRLPCTANINCGLSRLGAGDESIGVLTNIAPEVVALAKKFDTMVPVNWSRQGAVSTPKKWVGLGTCLERGKRTQIQFDDVQHC